LTEDERVTHLLRRAAFGAPPDQVAAARRQGWRATLDRLLNFESVADPTGESLAAVEPDLLDLHNLHDAQVWWLYRLVHSPRPLEEKMTLFWHGHFATANSKVANPELMVRQNQLFRRRAAGSFLDLLLDVYRDPAMLIWLDGATNRRGSPNENFGRENMELFTVGLGNYTQADVRAASRAFTGWTLRGRTEPVFVPRLHDDGVKTFLGVTGNLGGDDVMRILAGRRETARLIGRKLFSFFAYDDPEPAVVEHLADAYLRSRYSISAVLRALFSSDAFYSPRAVWGHLKSPVEYVVGMLRQLGARYELGRVPYFLAQMGQELFNPPNVGGWPGGPAWVNAATVHARFAFAQTVVAPEQGGAGAVDVPALVRASGASDGVGLVDFLARHLLAPQLRPETLAALRQRAAGIDLTAPPYRWLAPVRGLVHLALVAPEYHLG
jgi:uncharacterized protein (DUF1800 family)